MVDQTHVHAPERQGTGNLRVRYATSHAFQQPRLPRLFLIVLVVQLAWEGA